MDSFQVRQQTSHRGPTLAAMALAAVLEVHLLPSVNTGQWLAHFNGCLREPRARALRLTGYRFG